MTKCITRCINQTDNYQKYIGGAMNVKYELLKTLDMFDLNLIIEVSQPR